MFLKDYISDIYYGVKSLLKGMRRTGYYFTHHKEIITQQYPDNRETLNLAERFRGEVVMKHDENNEHACTGCTACELACPNATIKIITKFDITPEGKKKKALDNGCICFDILFHFHFYPGSRNSCRNCKKNISCSNMVIVFPGRYSRFI